MSIETPFPVEGTITPRENGFGASLPCESEWLSETENGDILQRAVDRASREYGNGVEVAVVFHDDGHGNAQSFDLLGLAEETDTASATLDRGDWGKVVDALRECAEIEQYGDHIDRAQGRHFERLAEDLQEQTDAC
ncbi:MULTISPECIES: hypothetical protein [Halorussus]|uniref:hypothetical protein n=1 Tax=Halorussus TaxID=1070314 RepID=UPI0020A0A5AD|nr:hypothetical protein [Halorussus vallis]USZ78604.1 hypothetical protein NGM07_24970 [Halorussus vallis]